MGVKNSTVLVVIPTSYDLALPQVIPPASSPSSTQEVANQLNQVTQAFAEYTLNEDGKKELKGRVEDLTKEKEGLTEEQLLQDNLAFQRERTGRIFKEFYLNPVIHTALVTTFNSIYAIPLAVAFPTFGIPFAIGIPAFCGAGAYAQACEAQKKFERIEAEVKATYPELSDRAVFDMALERFRPDLKKDPNPIHTLPI